MLHQTVTKMIMITIMMTAIALALTVVSIVITSFLEEDEDMEVVEVPDLAAVEEEDIVFHIPPLYGQKMRQVLMQLQIKSW